MTTLDKINFAEAELSLGLANSPIFLLRRLQEDPAILTMVSSCDGREILRELKAIAKRVPSLGADAVKPYAYLIALFMKGDVENFEKAATVKAPYAEWFSYIANFLRQQASPTSNSAISFNNDLFAAEPSPSASTTTSYAHIRR